MFATRHSDINSLKSRLFHLTCQMNSQKSGAAKGKDGIISETKLLETISVNRYNFITPSARGGIQTLTLYLMMMSHVMRENKLLCNHNLKSDLECHNGHHNDIEHIYTQNYWLICDTQYK